MNQYRSPFSQGMMTRPSGQDMPPPKEDLSVRGPEKVLRAKGDLRLGLPVILRDGSDRCLVAFVEPLAEHRFNALELLGKMELVLTRRRAVALGCSPEPACHAVRLSMPAGVGQDWVHRVAGLDAADRGAAETDLPPAAPGGPVEAAVLALAKAAQAVPAAVMVRLDDTVALTDLVEIDVATVTDALATSSVHERVSSAHLPMHVTTDGRVHVFRPEDGDVEHYAIEIGTPDLTLPVTVRLHSACFTGDVLGSLKCDCGPQLRAAMASMAEAGGGVLLYLNQEGRGIGMANKMRAYALQERGLDTVEANHWLGFEDDQRDFRIGVQILRHIGIKQVRLMTNNPSKLTKLREHGIDVVERIPLKVGRTRQNAAYLATKAAKSGHML